MFVGVVGDDGEADEVGDVDEWRDDTDHVEESGGGVEGPIARASVGLASRRLEVKRVCEGGRQLHVFAWSPTTLTRRCERPSYEPERHRSGKPSEEFPVQEIHVDRLLRDLDRAPDEALPDWGLRRRQSARSLTVRSEVRRRKKE